MSKIALAKVLVYVRCALSVVMVSTAAVIRTCQKLNVSKICYLDRHLLREVTRRSMLRPTNHIKNFEVLIPTMFIRVINRAL